MAQFAPSRKPKRQIIIHWFSSKFNSFVAEACVLTNKSNPKKFKTKTKGVFITSDNAPLIESKMKRANDRKKEADQNDDQTKRSAVASEVADQVGGYYGSRPNGVGERERTQLQKFNNAIKRILLSLYLPRGGMKVLDVAGGKGGDFRKFQDLKVGHLVHADIADVSVQHARERYAQDGWNCPIEFIVVDCFGERFVDRLDTALWFDLVTCQFALHYAFESEARLRMGLQNISSKLKPGGYFCGTVPNVERLLKLVQGGVLVWKNSICSVEFDPLTKTDPLPEFGAKYTFFLKNCVENVPEYLVDFRVLERYAREVGLVLVLREGFCDFYHAHRDKARFNIKKLSKVQLEVADLYVVFAFRKQ